MTRRNARRSPVSPIPAMKTYEIYMKSHCEAPDWENEIIAMNRKEACQILSKDTDWFWQDLLPYVREVK